MSETKGWLYVNSHSATFVSDEPLLGFEKYKWSVLADKILLESFLTFFEPQKSRNKKSFDSYYIEIDKVVLDAWFDCLVYENESTIIQ